MLNYVKGLSGRLCLYRSVKLVQYQRCLSSMLRTQLNAVGSRFLYVAKADAIAETTSLEIQDRALGQIIYSEAECSPWSPLVLTKLFLHRQAQRDDSVA